MANQTKETNIQTNQNNAQPAPSKKGWMNESFLGSDTYTKGDMVVIGGAMVGGALMGAAIGRLLVYIGEHAQDTAFISDAFEL
jgi:predicted lipid-binding transport protein (Tim44 family)